MTDDELETIKSVAIMVSNPDKDKEYTKKVNERVLRLWMELATDVVPKIVDELLRFRAFGRDLAEAARR